MRHATPDRPSSDLVRRLAAGASTTDMMRRGEIAGQALGLLQMVAAQTVDAGHHPPAHTRIRDPHSLAEAN